MKQNTALFSLILSAVFTLYTDAAAQNPIPPSDTILELQHDTNWVDVDTLYQEPSSTPDTVIYYTPLSKQFFRPVTYTNYHYFDNIDPFKKEVGDKPELRWIEQANAASNNELMALQRFAIATPWLVTYNLAWLPHAPKQYTAVVNPSKHTIEIHEVTPGDIVAVEGAEIKKRHWIRSFAASAQFSQAYISPNWYQGGNNNLNVLINLSYDVKLNPAYHPKLLFESSFRYKLGLNSAPDDSLRNYSISEDLLQINTTFGIKAAHRWYYSVAAQFKTQLLNSYATNTNNLKAAFLSPGELNVGLGMTYNFVNKKKTFTFDASISPLTYNLKTCTSSRMYHPDFGVDEGRDTKTKIGSSGEFKLGWKIARNITFNSRLFAFTDYDNFQADWENTLGMDINRFLSTQIYVHVRYDTSTPRIADNPDWHKLQVKEIRSFGISYKFSSI